MYLLDTNVISELRKAKTGKANPYVVTWASNILPDELFLSAISILELELGVLLIERRDPTQGKLLRTWLNNQVIANFSKRILNIDEKVAKCCAQLHVPNPQPERDALIAATALVHNLTVVTRNVDDFKPTSVITLNPWQEIINQ